VTSSRHSATNLSAGDRLTDLDMPVTGTLASADSPAASVQRAIVVLSGITANNLGDDAMLVATVRDLRRINPGTEMVILAEDPTRCGPVAAQIDVPILYSPQLFIQTFLAALPEGEDPSVAVLWLARKILSDREAILQSKRRPWLPERYAEGLRRLLSADGVADCGGASLTVHWKPYFYEKCLDYLLAPRPLFISGQQVGPFDLPKDRDLLWAALSKATEITLREPVSERYLRSIGCEVPMKITGDDTLTLEATWTARCKLLLNAAGIDPDQPFLAFQYRHYLDYEEDRFYDRFAAFVDEAICATGLPVVGVPMHFGATDERNHLVEIGRRLAHAEHFYLVRAHLTPADAKAIFATATAAFGISYHSAVFSLSSGTPFLGLHRGTHYTQKMQGLSELYDLPELAVPVDETTPKAFAQLLLTQLERRDLICRHLLARHEALVKEVRESRRRFLERVCLTLIRPSVEIAQREFIDRQLTSELKNVDTEVFQKAVKQAHEAGVITQMHAHARKRKWRRVMRDLLVLVRYHPRALVVRAQRKLRSHT
jgi:polysaccharide pyruvyl transferase WcaK-like protein